MLTNTLLALSIATLSATATPQPQPVNEIDVERYVGKWYEIAKLPTNDQPNCGDVVAEYELLDDGQIGVTNSCLYRFFFFKFNWYIRGKPRPFPEKWVSLS